MRSVVWDTTSRCNLRCKHCYNGEKYFEHFRNDLTTDQVTAMLRFLKNQGCKKLSLLGGEPLFRTDILEVIKALREVNIPTQLTTNGTLLSGEIITAILSSPIEIINISLDGGTPTVNDAIRGRGSYDAVVRNVRCLMEEAKHINRNITITIGYVVTMTNMQTSNDIIDLCKELGIQRIVVSSLMFSGNAVRNWDVIKINQFKLLETVEQMIAYTQKNYPSLVFQIDGRPLLTKYFNMKYGIDVIYSIDYTKCGALDGLIYIEADGTCHPCGLYGMEVGKKAIAKQYFSIDDVRNVKDLSDINQLYSTAYFTDFFESMHLLEKKDPSGHCTSCEFSNDCYLCPYQREGDIIDCNFAVEKITEYKQTLDGIVIDAIASVPKKFLSEREFDVYRNLRQCESVLRNFTYVKNATNITEDEYLYILHSLERRFIIERRPVLYEA